MTYIAFNDRGQVAYWVKFPEASAQSIATLLREHGEMTKEAAQTLVTVSATWAMLTITLEWGTDKPFVAGKGSTHVALRLDGVSRLKVFDIRSWNGLVRPPLPGPDDPVGSSSLLRAISGGAALSGFHFSRTLFPEVDRETELPLPAAAKPDALTLAQQIWSYVVKKLAIVKLGDHTERDSMGSTNLGTMFKVTSLLLAQGALCKYVLCGINEFQFVFVAGKTLCTWDLGLARRVGFYPRLRSKRSMYL